MVVFGTIKGEILLMSLGVGIINCFSLDSFATIFREKIQNRWKVIGFRKTELFYSTYTVWVVRLWGEKSQRA